MSLVQKQAPDFTAKAVVNGDFTELKLSDYRGKWVVLFFYPLDFTGVCQSEVITFAKTKEHFKKLGCELIGVSVDSQFSHQAWTKQLKSEGQVDAIGYPLVSDLKKTISADYGILNDGGVALRAHFIINPDGKVVAEMVNDLLVGRNTEEVLREVQAFQHLAKTGQACMVNWKPA